MSNWESHSLWACFSKWNDWKGILIELQGTSFIILWESFGIYHKNPKGNTQENTKSAIFFLVWLFLLQWQPPQRSLDGYKHVVDVEYCPPVSSEGPQFPPEAAKAKEAAQSSPNTENTAEYHDILEGKWWRWQQLIILAQVCGCESCIWSFCIDCFWIASIRGNDTWVTKVGMEESWCQLSFSILAILCP